MSKTILAPALALLALAACNSGEQEPAAPDGAPTSEPTVAAPLPSMVPPVAPETPSAQVTANQIPTTMQGRWGLVPADCEAGRADAKGLLEIGPTQLKFYESLGTLTMITEGTDSRIRGNFSFTGEGMEWQRDQVLDLQDGGKTLIRREYGADAAPGPLKYTKCA